MFQSFYERIKCERGLWVLTPDDKLLTLDTCVSFSALEKRDPVMHFLRWLSHAMQHPMSCDDHKWVWPGQTRERENVLHFVTQKKKYKTCTTQETQSSFWDWTKHLFSNLCVWAQSIQGVFTFLGYQMHIQNQSSPRPMCPKTNTQTFTLHHHLMNHALIVNECEDVHV